MILFIVSEVDRDGSYGSSHLDALPSPQHLADLGAGNEEGYVPQQYHETEADYHAMEHPPPHAAYHHPLENSPEFYPSVPPPALLEQKFPQPYKPYSRTSESKFKLCFFLITIFCHFSKVRVKVFFKDYLSLKNNILLDFPTLTRLDGRRSMQKNNQFSF